MKSIDKLRYRISLALQPCYNELIKRITTESFSEKYLRVFISEAIEFYGTEQTINFISSQQSIKDSIRLDNLMADQTNELDLQIALLRGAVLYQGRDNEYLSYARKQIEEKNIEELIQMLNSNSNLKRALVENFVLNHELTATDIYKTQDLDRKVIRSLLLLDEYKNERLAKERKKTKEKRKKNN